MFGKVFGFRARDEARQMTLGEIQLKEQNGEKYLEFQERSTKTRDGSNIKNVRDTTPKLFNSTQQKEPSLNPIQLYQLYIEKRPLSMMHLDSPFFLTPIPLKRLSGIEKETWYYPRPMGENTLGNLMKEAAAMASIEKKVTNHSVRKTTVTSLSRAGVPPQKIMKITGHRNIQSITHYDDELNENEHRNMCNILQGGEATAPLTLQNSPTVQKPEEKQSLASAFPPGCVFNNCTFNF